MYYEQAINEREEAIVKSTLERCAEILKAQDVDPAFKLRMATVIRQLSIKDILESVK